MQGNGMRLGMTRMGRWLGVMAVAGGWVLGSAGCHTTRVTEPQRSVAEQLLLSSATDRAVLGANFEPLRGRKVFVQERYFDSYDKGHALGVLREAMSRAGARLVGVEADAEWIVEPRSSGLGLDTRDSLVGIPSLNIPIPLAGPIATPELALYKALYADSAARFAVFAYERATGEHQHATGPLAGAAHFHHYRFLGLINWRRTDVPELDPKLRKAKQAR